MFGYEVSISFEDIFITIVVPYASNFYCYSTIVYFISYISSPYAGDNQGSKW